MPLISLFHLPRAELCGALREGTWREQSEVGALFRLDCCSPSPYPSPSRETMLQILCRTTRGSPGVGLEEASWFWLQSPLWRFRDSGILGVGWERVTVLSKPDQPLPGEGGVMSSQGLSFCFSCGGSFLSHLQLRKCTVEIRDVVPFHPSPQPLLNHSLPARGPLGPSLTSGPEARPLARLQ